MPHRAGGPIATPYGHSRRPPRAIAGRIRKQALVQDESTPFFSTTHFDGHPSVLVRASRLGELSLAELQEIVQDAWLARASRHRAEQWLISHPASGMPSAG
jgi:hypothetical protein